VLEREESLEPLQTFLHGNGGVSYAHGYQERTEHGEATTSDDPYSIQEQSFESNAELRVFMEDFCGFWFQLQTWNKVGMKHLFCLLVVFGTVSYLSVSHLLCSICGLRHCLG
jgi:hypothetical protein